MKATHDCAEIAAWLLTCIRRCGIYQGCSQVAPASRGALVAESSHRVDEAGDRCFLWLGDSSGTWPSGVWAAGMASDKPRIGEGDPQDPYWLDANERQKERPYVGVELVSLTHPFSARSSRRMPALPSPK
jgi:hypothetical protein